ncbi:tyrosine-type recombinase/integrase [Sphingomonas histidinilytica]|uniref:tyrosine-type recombinase/integrase n=1 Tax=Rhizorhabdus histidinilytica TaxID=439228 RepID=UPI001ADB82BC|nr:tyrosine-type recombinase/integrase [Rhizorhabdus histidinilytica]MBO9379820.1 tyrosine-type recombinase/integrase [Rhizorhabdus histidinilytica]
MASKIRYVSKRNGVYQYIRRVPNSVVNKPVRFEAFFKSQAVFRRSLRTKEQLAAYEAAKIAHEEFELLLAQALGRPSPTRTEPKVALKKVTQADLDTIAEQAKESVIKPVRQSYLRADADPLAAAELERLYHEIEVEAEEIKAASQPGSRSAVFGETMKEHAEWVVKHHHFNAPPGSDEFGLIIAALRSGRAQGYAHVDKLRDGNITPTIPTPASIAKAATGPTLREVVERYKKFKGFGKKPASEIDLSLNIFESVVGNKSLAALTKSDFHRYVEHLADSTVGGKTAGSIKRAVSAQTVKKRLGILCTAINFAISRDWFDRSNPAAGINIDAFVKKPDKAIMPDKRPFKISELNALLKHPWFTGCKSASETHLPGSHRLNGAEFWVPIVALFSGCRASELGGLRVAEVHLDDKHPHFAIRANIYRRIKNSEARDVPILDVLVKLGFKEYYERIKKTGADRLFPDWEKGAGDSSGWGNSKLVRAINRTVIPTALKATLAPGARTEVTFHNFRSAFKTMLVSSEKSLHPNIINEVVGHAKGEMDSRYVGKVPIEVTYEAVKDCTYKGLTLPPTPVTSTD